MDKKHFIKIIKNKNKSKINVILFLKRGIIDNKKYFFFKYIFNFHKIKESKSDKKMNKLKKGIKILKKG